MHRVADYPLWFGHVGDVRDVAALERAGVLALVDLAGSEPAQSIGREKMYCRFPLTDGPGNPPWLVRLAVEAVTGLLRSQTPTLVFCGAGMSRSPSIAAAAVARFTNCELPVALRTVLRDGKADVSPGLWADVLRCGTDAAKS